MKLFLIRHGATKGNTEHRYVGTTDEGLLAESRGALKEKRKRMCLPEIKQVYVSPMRRCVETAQILFPNSRYIAVEEFCECNFGEFEYLNYKELNGNPSYREFIRSRGMSGFPNGESREAFQKRCIEGLLKIVPDIAACGRDAALVVHGGTIMSLLDRFSAPHEEYYEWQTENGSGFMGEIIFQDEGKIQIRNIVKI